MSTSLLYDGFGIRGYTYGRTEYEGGQVISPVRYNAPMRLGFSSVFVDDRKGRRK
jgi:hypothetical protein